MPAPASLDSYTGHSPLTDPAPYADLFTGLPVDLPALHRVVQNIYIHVWKIRKYHPAWLENRSHEYESRSVARSLALVMAHDPQPLTVERPRAQKLIVDCRHHAVLLVALLRHHGIPARARCGFATYLEQSHFQDHWICEYWDGSRWVMEDPDVVKHDISPDAFINAGRAWQMIRAGMISDLQFGFSPHDRGEWVVRCDIVRDLAALNHAEMLSSDAWGFIEKPEALVTTPDRALLDEAARLIAAVDSDYTAMREFYQSSPDLRVPDEVNCYNYAINRNTRVLWDDRPTS